MLTQKPVTDDFFFEVTQDLQDSPQFFQQLLVNSDSQSISLHCGACGACGCGACGCGACGCGACGCGACGCGGCR